MNAKDTEACHLPPLVLLVEDYEDARSMYGQYLLLCGFRVALAADGFEAIERASELLPDLILMDLSLPRLDGWEATRRLRRDGRTRHIPVVAITAHVIKEASDRARRAGCCDVIFKPCAPDDLVLRVRELLLDNRPACRIH
jgi:two-component system, cell cycle response regulator DivK